MLTDLLRSWLLSEERFRRHRKTILRATERFRHGLAAVPVQHHDLPLLPLLEHRILGHNINAATLISSELANPWLQRQLFRWLFRLRLWRRHRGDTSRYAAYDVALTTVRPARIPRFRPWALVTCCDPSYLLTLRGVLRELDRRGKSFILLLPRKAQGWSTAQQLSFRHGRIIFVEDVVTPTVLEALARQFPPLADEQSFQKSCQLRTARGTVSLLPSLSPALPTIQHTYLPHAAAYVTLATELFRQWKPRILVGAKLRRAYDKAFFAVARQLGIPSVALQPVHLTDDLIAFYDQGDFSTPTAAVLWDAEQQSLVQRRPGVSSKLYALGNPQWDAMLAVTPGRAAATLGQRYAVIATQPAWRSSDVRQAVEAVRAAGLAPVLKLHPRDRPERYAWAADILFHNEVSTYELLRDARLLITNHSNIAYEALLLGTPACLLDTTRRPHPSVRRVFERYQRLGIPLCKNAPALRREIARLIARPRTPRLSTAAAPRIVDLLERTARSS